MKDKEQRFPKLDDFVDAAAELLYRKGYKEIVTLDECVDFCRQAKEQFPSVAGFVLAVKKNYDPRNENDNLIVILGLIDENNKPISSDGKESQSKVMHTKTIDKKIVDFLNGNDTVIFKL